ncbi:hypothetical protein niasHT_011689 [Heterodera trifolii]|uniref:Tartrate-resistant acid phosphatase type 5 n=1 Tax=Heterodera trifolii TaxID=157864 RepID=A0ABD2L361_9BILA
MSHPSHFLLPFVSLPRNTKFVLLFLLLASAMVSMLCLISGLFLLPPDIHSFSSTPSEQDANRQIPLTTVGRLSCVTEAGCVLSDTSQLNFLVVGDIGGLPVFPYYSYAQTKVARAMAKIGRRHRTHFVVNVGDNFYFNGVQTAFDGRFEDSFEEIYDQPELLVPWYTIAGNHDHLGNVTAQLARTDFSSRWTFPRLFYKVRLSFDGLSSPSAPSAVRVDLLMLDTVVLCGNTVDVQGDSLFNWLFAQKREPNGPSAEHRQLAVQQWAWIEQQMRRSDADYLFVVGHYPIHSVSEHGSFACLRRLDSLLHSHGANAYFSGHDHTLQHIRFGAVPSEDVKGTVAEDRHIHYIVSGAASRTDRSAKHIEDVPKEALLFRYPTGWNPFSQIGFSNGGFVQVQLQRNNGTMNFYSGTQQKKHSFELKPRRRRGTDGTGK